MASIFISHSRHDRQIIQDFQQVFAVTPVQALLMEFEEYQPPPWREIRQKVVGASAVFLLLGPGLRGSPYTQNWVAWEVGVAAALGKPTWVYEQVGNHVDFPVPYCTDYVLYQPGRREDLGYIRQVVEAYDPGPQFGAAFLGALLGAALGGPGGAAWGGLGGAALGARRPPEPPQIACPHPTCGIGFRAHTAWPSFPCPSCRQLLRLSAQ